MKPVFEYRAYKKYLLDFIEERAAVERGIRSRLARAAGCQSAYISQVLNGHAHLSLEQAEAVNSYLAHTDEESAYFLLLVQFGRAGTKKLRARLIKQIRDVEQRRLDLKNRIQTTPTISIPEMARYFSQWDIAAVHALFSTERFRSRPAIAARLGLPERRVGEILEFLESTGQARKKGEVYEHGVARMHLASDSAVLPLHHRNWRLRAMETMNREPGADAHYTSVATFSEKDVEKVKKMWVEFVLELKQIVSETDPSDLHCLCFDFFRA